jgi:CDGSH-type Zn-finger protein
MDEPVVASFKPCLVALVEGQRYKWCTCGLSKTQPFCDMSHVGTEFRPLIFRAQETDEELLCACKRTKTPPYCDGTHNSLSDSYGEPMDDAASDAQLVPMAADAHGAGRAALDSDCFVIRPGDVATFRAGALSLYQVIGPKDGAKRLSQFAGTVQPGHSEIVRFAGSDTVIYAISGSGTIEIADRSFDFNAESSAFVRAGEAFRIHCRTPMRVNVTVCPLGAQPEVLNSMPTEFDDSTPNRIEIVDASKRSEMADRFYQVLVDGDTQRTEVTQFIGHIPQSRAAHHRHLYEETLTHKASHRT